MVLLRPCVSLTVMGSDFAWPNDAEIWVPIALPPARYLSPRYRYWESLDGVARLGLFAGGYGVDSGDASLLVDLVFASRRQALAHIRAEIAAGNRTWVDNWRETNGEERAAADDAWLERHREALVAIVAG